MTIVRGTYCERQCRDVGWLFIGRFGHWSVIDHCLVTVVNCGYTVPARPIVTIEHK